MKVTQFFLILMSFHVAYADDDNLFYNRVHSGAAKVLRKLGVIKEPALLRKLKAIRADAIKCLYELKYDSEGVIDYYIDTLYSNFYQHKIEKICKLTKVSLSNFNKKSQWSLKMFLQKDYSFMKYMRKDAVKTLRLCFGNEIKIYHTDQNHIKNVANMIRHDLDEKIKAFGTSKARKNLFFAEQVNSLVNRVRESLVEIWLWLRNPMEFRILNDNPPGRPEKILDCATSVIKKLESSVRKDIIEIL